MPLGAARITLLARSAVTAAAEVIRKKVGVSAVGNAQVDTAQSKFGGASALFDGTGDYLLVNETADMNFGTEDFTIECWVRRNSTGTTQVIWDQRPLSTYNRQPGLFVTSGNALAYFNGTSTVITGTTSLTTGVWYHTAVCRSSGSTKLFLNGTQEGSTYTDTNNYDSGDPCVGCNSSSRTQNWNGWIDEVRISNTARYTASFTPSTTPFVNDENTLLLLHMDGTDASTYFEDDNGVRARVGVSASGNAQVDTAQSKFGGASALFDGTDDALQITDVSWIDWNNDFTLELWIRMSAYGEQVFFDTREGSGGNSTGGYLVRDSGSVLRFYLNGTSIVSKSDPNITTNTWYHVAVTRSGNNFNLWINGTSVSSATSSATGTAYKCYIGRNSYSTSSGNTVGNLDEFRFSNTARYTANFTPATTPFVNDENTLLLLHMDGTDGSTYFPDDVGSRSRVGITAVGGAQVDTARSKFGGSSLYLSGGSGNYLENVDFPALGTGDFTIEWFQNLDILNQSTAYMYLDARPGSNGAYPLIWTQYSNNTVVYYFVDGANRITSATNSLVADTWQHIAIVRSSGTTTMYIDGSATGTPWSDSTNYLATTRFRIGGNMNGINSVEGWMDEFRVSDTARYTGNFTPATEPFQNDSNTLLLLHMDGTDGSTYFPDDNGVTPDYDYGA